MFGIYPNNIELYKLALIHKSASIVLDDGTHINNERLEYLGDAVIEAVVSDMLYIDFPYEKEGALTQLRSRIVSRSSLNELALRLGLDEYVVSYSSFNNSRKHIYGDAFEAMMGAIYLDKGYDFTNRLLINGIFKRYVDMNSLLETETDYKSRLIEWCQKKKKHLNIASHEGGNNEEDVLQFYAVVTIENVDYGYGIGESKKEAEQRACRNTVEKLHLSF
ncbi:MAG TPA: ribonuclease III [Candidatus Avirikenella pullistercoris]|nr:ribonuclease III [Candidatus Avirikenella pullistercoris]